MVDVKTIQGLIKSQPKTSNLLVRKPKQPSWQLSRYAIEF